MPKLLPSMYKQPAAAHACHAWFIVGKNGIFSNTKIDAFISFFPGGRNYNEYE